MKDKCYLRLKEILAKAVINLILFEAIEISSHLKYT